MRKCNFPDFTRIHMEIRYEKLNHGNFGGRSLDEFIRNQTIFATMSSDEFKK